MLSVNECLIFLSIASTPRASFKEFGLVGQANGEAPQKLILRKLKCSEFYQFSLL